MDLQAATDNIPTVLIFDVSDDEGLGRPSHSTEQE